MADLLALEIVTPERLLVREDVTAVQAPATTGYLGILPGHAPLLAELGTGFLNFEAGGKRWYLAVHGGYLEVLDNRVRVLATAAERAEEIDIERAKADMKKAQEEVFNASLGVDPAVALGAMARAQARLDAAAQKQPGQSA
ncbi:MAG TPA: F0F1 ATP synthase subunit epsilon [Bryobacteraceae bacterium]|jgi:F-type H+-transporting ATPase subunit epsilon|nr:F0F1 ATP synthase subunit epsilon [Bryobacteraceae bacterium]